MNSTEPDEGGPEETEPSAVAAGYASNEEYLRDELERVDLLLKAFLLRQKSANLVRTRLADDPSRFPPAGNAILAHAFRWADPVVEESCRREIERVLRRAKQKEGVIVERLRLTPGPQRSRMPLWRLIRLHALVPNLAEAVLGPGQPERAGRPPRDTLALDILLLALLADRAPRYRAALAESPAEDGSLPGWLTAETALQVAQAEADPRRARWEILGPQGPLVAPGLIDLGDAAAGPLARRPLRIDERIADFLLGRDTLDPLLVPAARLVMKRWEWDRLFLDEPTKRSLRQLADLWWERRGKKVTEEPDSATWPDRIVLLLHGSAGSPFLLAVHAFFTRGKTGEVAVLVVDLTKALVAAANWDHFVRRCYREAGLRGAAVFWQGWEALLASGQPADRWEAVIRQAEQSEVSTFIGSEVAWNPVDLFRLPSRSFVRVELRPPAGENPPRHLEGPAGPPPPPARRGRHSGPESRSRPARIVPVHRGPDRRRAGRRARTAPGSRARQSAPERGTSVRRVPAAVGPAAGVVRPACAAAPRIQ